MLGMTETVLARLSNQLDRVSEIIDLLQDISKESLCEPIREELNQTIEALKTKYKKLQKQYKVAYNDMLEFADFLSSVDY
jgi:acyl carrier protein phosphodiesterase